MIYDKFSHTLIINSAHCIINYFLYKNIWMVLYFILSKCILYITWLSILIYKYTDLYCWTKPIASEILARIYFVNDSLWQEPKSTQVIKMQFQNDPIMAQQYLRIYPQMLESSLKYLHVPSNTLYILSNTWI